MLMTDALFLHRPCSDEDLELARAAQRHARRVWVDYDDDVFAVPSDNPAHAFFNRDGTQARMATILREADQVSVSTAALKERFEHGGLLRRRKSPAVVIRNALDISLFPYRDATPPPRRKTVLWRGSATHHQDLAQYLPAMLEVSRSFPDWNWNFLGAAPDFLADAGFAELTLAPPVDPLSYFNNIHELSPSVIIVPLCDTPFNRSKSNIAWLEAMFAGAVALVPDWPEWRRPGAINYAGPEDFRAKLSSILRGEIDVARMSARGWNYVQRYLSLSRVNQQRLRLLQRLAPNED